ncbi:MAG: zf-HC2 domain-containing protein [Gammaproteobacteria bacterium]|nr:zf-HC2 domain-containing protein [Gammaproteobacteria bacterium]
MPRLHPNLDLLSEYSAGALGAAQNAAVSAHLHFCDRCRDHVYSLEEVGGCLVEQADAQPVSESMLDTVMARIEETETGSAARVQAPPMLIDLELERLPASVQRLLPAGRRQWRYLSPSLEVAQIPVGEVPFRIVAAQDQGREACAPARSQRAGDYGGAAGDFLTTTASTNRATSLFESPVKFTRQWQPGTTNAFA